MATPIPRLLRIDQVMERTALGRTTIYDRLKRSEFPEPLRLGRKCVRWSEEDINDWIRQKKA